MGKRLDCPRCGSSRPEVLVVGGVLVVAGVCVFHGTGGKKSEIDVCSQPTGGRRAGIVVMLGHPPARNSFRLFVSWKTVKYG